MKNFKMIGVMLTLMLSFFSFAQVEMPEDVLDVTFRVEQSGEDATVIANIKMQEGWHINAIELPEESFGFPSSLTIEENANFKKVGKVIEPNVPERYDPVSGEDMKFHEGVFEFKQKIKVKTKKDFKIDVLLEFQPCDSVKCLFPGEVQGTVNVKGVKKASSVDSSPSNQGAEETSAHGDDEAIDETDIATKKNEADEDAVEVIEDEDIVSAAEDDPTKEETETRSLWWMFGVSFLSGLAALLTPCVFPMIPMTVSFFTGQSDTRTKGISNAVKYGVAIMAIFIALGTLVSATFGAGAMNSIATNPTLNIFFFIIFVVFAVSFLGAFEIRLPSSWINKADANADKKGGLIGIFFMALVLVLVSFSCTGPIVGFVLVQSATVGGWVPVLGMFGFSLALALPFALFAAFPGWMNSLPKSGGWLNVVKVVLGFIELAFAFKFLSNADLAIQGHYLEREVFLAIWIAIFAALTLYLFGKIRFPLDSPVEKLSVGRGMFATLTLAFTLYMVPGMWGAPLKLISAFPPPMSYSESPLGVGKTNQITASSDGSENRQTDFVEGLHLGPQNIMVFHDYDRALAHAQKEGKPLFVDFTGFNCVNCRRMEESVWGEPGIYEALRDSVVIASLHVDSRVKLPKEEWKEVEINGKNRTLKTVGDLWMYKQVSEYGVASQPYYIFQDTEGNDLANGPADYEHHSKVRDFKAWVKDGLKDFHRVED